MYVPGGWPVHLITPFENYFTRRKKYWRLMSQQENGPWQAIWIFKINRTLDEVDAIPIGEQSEN